MSIEQARMNTRIENALKSVLTAEALNRNPRYAGMEYPMDQLALRFLNEQRVMWSGDYVYRWGKRIYRIKRNYAKHRHEGRQIEETPTLIPVSPDV